MCKKPLHHQNQLSAKLSDVNISLPFNRRGVPFEAFTFLRVFDVYFY